MFRRMLGAAAVGLALGLACALFVPGVTGWSWHRPHQVAGVVLNSTERGQVADAAAVMDDLSVYPPPAVVAGVMGRQGVFLPSASVVCSDQGVCNMLQGLYTSNSTGVADFLSSMWSQMYPWLSNTSSQTSNTSGYLAGMGSNLTLVASELRSQAGLWAGDALSGILSQVTTVGTQTTNASGYLSGIGSTVGQVASELRSSGGVWAGDLLSMIRDSVAVLPSMASGLLGLSSASVAMQQAATAMSAAAGAGGFTSEQASQVSTALAVVAAGSAGCDEQGNYDPSVLASLGVPVPPSTGAGGGAIPVNCILQKVLGIASKTISDLPEKIAQAVHAAQAQPTDPQVQPEPTPSPTGASHVVVDNWPTPGSHPGAGPLPSSVSDLPEGVQSVWGALTGWMGSLPADQTAMGGGSSDECPLGVHFAPWNMNAELCLVPTEPASVRGVRRWVELVGIGLQVFCAVACLRGILGGIGIGLWTGSEHLAGKSLELPSGQFESGGDFLGSGRFEPAMWGGRAMLTDLPHGVEWGLRRIAGRR